MDEQYPEGAVYTHNGVTTYLGRDGTKCFVDHAKGTTKWLDAHGRITHIKSREPIHRLEKAYVAGIDAHGKPKLNLPIMEEWTTYNSVGKIVRNDQGEACTYNYKEQIVGRILADGTREVLTYDGRGRHRQTIGVQADGETTYAIEFFYDLDGSLLRAVENRAKQPEKTTDLDLFFTPPSAISVILEETPINAGCSISEKQPAQEKIVDINRLLKQNLHANTDDASVALEMTPIWTINGQSAASCLSDSVQ